MTYNILTDFVICATAMVTDWTFVDLIDRPTDYSACDDVNDYDSYYDYFNDAAWDDEVDDG